MVPFLKVPDRRSYGNPFNDCENNLHAQLNPKASKLLP